MSLPILDVKIIVTTTPRKANINELLVSQLEIHWLMSSNFLMLFSILSLIGMEAVLRVGVLTPGAFASDVFPSDGVTLDLLVEHISIIFSLDYKSSLKSNRNTFLL